jgi:GTP cyclohydrolase I
MEYPVNSPEWHFKEILEHLGEDTNREGLKETPKRYIKFMREFLDPKEFNFTTFDAEGTDEMILQTNIPFYSICEHHTAPFFGTADVAYIPNEKIVGLSKLARTVDLYANRFQNQERITTQIAERLQLELNPKGVAVHLKAQHLCMCMRGVKKHDTWTSTSKLLGAFKDDEKARSEFLNLITK